MSENTLFSLSRGGNDDDDDDVDDVDDREKSLVFNRQWPLWPFYSLCLELAFEGGTYFYTVLSFWRPIWSLTKCSLM